MKDLKYTFFFVLLALLAGCENFTDVKPKGKNILDKVTDLDQLLNYQYSEAGFEAREAYILVNDMLPSIYYPYSQFDS